MAPIGENEHQELVVIDKASDGTLLRRAVSPSSSSLWFMPSNPLSWVHEWIPIKQSCRRYGRDKGIGRAIAEALAREGASVAICGRSKEASEKVATDIVKATGGNVHGTAVDVRDAVCGFNFLQVHRREFRRVGHPCKQCGYRYF